MSSFAGLNLALSGLTAQRQALQVTGQNMVNENTPGYTRQRANLQSVESSALPGLYGAGARGGGVVVTSYQRLGDIFLETRVRQEISRASDLSALATTWSRVEAVMKEPGKDGLAAQLQEFFTAWSDVGNDAGQSTTARAVLLEKAEALISRLQGDYQNVRTQWDTQRQQAVARVNEVNTVAQTVADLNAKIKSIVAAGESPNDLIDQRAQHATTLAGLVGGVAREREDGTLDIMVGGNALVRGDTVNKLTIVGTTQMAEVDKPGNAIRVAWADSVNRPLTLDGGELAGLLQGLAPAGEGGPLATLAQRYNEVALELSSSVNALHEQALTTGGNLGGAFFTEFAPNYDGTAVLDLKVLITDPTGVATAAAGQGPLDSSIGEKISKISTVGDLWASTVSSIGTQTRATSDRAKAAQADWTRANQDLLAGTGVNGDEEVTNLLMYQRGYDAAARLVTTIDQMLDVLINRTGIVGR